MSSRAIKFANEIDWRQPLPAYERILAARQQNLRALGARPGAYESLLQYYLDGHWAEFICDWGVTYDPRVTDVKLQYRPFVLSTRQIDYVDWLQERFTRQQRGVCRKHRDAGMSWIHGGVSALLWLARPGTVVTLGSQKEEKVDNGDDDPDSLFWKIRAFILHLPKPFQPPQWQKASKRHLVVNPSNGSVIKGEIGDGIGRGGRSTMALPDEFGELQHPQLVESSLSANSDCVIYGGTIPTTGWKGSHFWQLENQYPEEQVFVFEWWQDPRKRQNPQLEPESEPWYKQKKAEVSEIVFKTQYLMQDDASGAVQFIDSQLVLDAFKRRRSEVSIPVETPWRVGVDAAGQGNDKIKIWRRRGRVSLPALTFDKADGIQLANIIKDVVKELLKSGPVDMICIERDGPGGSCADQLKYTNLAPIVIPIHTGAKIDNGLDYNVRAWLHRVAKEYLEEEDPIIPYSKTFLVQATAIHYTHKSGRLLIESKEEYRARFAAGRSRAEKMASRSPDEWDSFMLSHMPPRGKAINSLSGQKVQRRAGWRALDAAMGY